MSNCRAVIAFPKTCQRCGIEFACGGSCCWCDEVVLDAGTRAALRQRFTDCLCRACLEAAGQLSSESPATCPTVLESSLDEERHDS